MCSGGINYFRDIAVISCHAEKVRKERRREKEEEEGKNGLVCV